MAKSLACASPATHSWYIDAMPDGEQARRDINRLDSTAAQYDTLTAYLETLSEKTDRWVCEYREG